MNNLFQQFFSLHNGRVVETEDSANYAQCFDLALAWCDFLKIPRSSIRHLYAYQIWTLATAETKKYFDLIPNTATNVVQVGDLAVFGTAVGYAGHVSIGTPNSNSINAVTFDENWAGKQYATTITHYNYYGVLGFLRPKNVTVPLTDTQKVSKIRDLLNHSLQRILGTRPEL